MARERLDPEARRTGGARDRARPEEEIRATLRVAGSAIDVKVVREPGRGCRLILAYRSEIE